MSPLTLQDGKVSMPSDDFEKLVAGAVIKLKVFGGEP